jgi:hypothetical protein
MTAFCDASLNSESTVPAAAAVAGPIDTNTALTILFGTMGLALAALQVLLSWQSVRALRHRGPPI